MNDILRFENNLSAFKKWNLFLNPPKNETPKAVEARRDTVIKTGQPQL